MFKQIAKSVFTYKGKYWFYNIKEIPYFFKRIWFFLKNGYDEIALWDTYTWFIDIITKILKWHRKHRNGTPIMSINYINQDGTVSNENEEVWNAELDDMIKLLSEMNEENPCMNDAKDKFFKKFSEYFYSLWD